MTATVTVADMPKSLSVSAVREARHEALRQSHIAPLSAFVERLRSSLGDAYQVPYFDPLDGGVSAECLFLLEAPGPNAIGSGFVSRNNPDETAKNFFLLNQQAGIDRARTVTWNIVPWYVGTGTKIRAVNRGDIEAALPSLRELLALLPRLRVVVLVGRKAASAYATVSSLAPDVQVFESPHPSPMFVNRSPENRGAILSVLRRVSESIDLVRSGV